MSLAIAIEFCLKLLKAKFITRISLLSVISEKSESSTVAGIKVNLYKKAWTACVISLANNAFLHG